MNKAYDTQLRTLALQKSIEFNSDGSSTDIFITALRFYDFLENGIVFQYENGESIGIYENGDKIYSVICDDK